VLPRTTSPVCSARVLHIVVETTLPRRQSAVRFLIRAACSPWPSRGPGRAVDRLRQMPMCVPDGCDTHAGHGVLDPAATTTVPRTAFACNYTRPNVYDQVSNPSSRRSCADRRALPGGAAGLFRSTGLGGQRAGGRWAMARDSMSSRYPDPWEFFGMRQRQQLHPPKTC